MRQKRKSGRYLIPQEIIESKILLIRGKKVMIDKDLAELYGVETRVLNQAVRRNIERFPEDFMFQLTKTEADSLRSQFVTLKKRRGQHSKYLPYVFIEPGVAMLSSVLNSEIAIQVNIQIIRTFIKLREMFSIHKELAYKFAELERKVTDHNGQIRTIFEVIRQLMAETEKSKKRIGFHGD